ncbi:hypothetical protein ACFGVS_26240 [Mucilaginibacter sp. AW1-7]|jgi:hypothetical protein|uniref:hypothetical protein n=1 Tax=Mucilaginibacter sp. AW1-7 TaxID=3349874 RepID=UPI003F733772
MRYFNNTGNVSLFLYLLFVGIAILGMIFICYLIFKSKLEMERIDKIIDVFKSVIVTTAIGTVTLIITDLFKERKQQLEEMSAFKDYLPYVTDNKKNLNDMKFLCDFMVSVAPEGLKKSWEDWRTKLNGKEDTLKTIAALQTAIVKQPDKPSIQQIKDYNKLEDKKQAIYQDLNLNVNNSYLVVIGANKTVGPAATELKFAKDSISQNAAIYKKGNWYRTVIPVTTNYDDAKAIVSLVSEKSKGKKAAYIVSLKSWCNSPTFSATENCYICNL